MKRYGIFISIFILAVNLYSIDEVFKKLNDERLKTDEFDTKIFYENLSKVVKGSREEIEIYDELLRFYVNIYQLQRNERNADLEKAISDKLGDKERARALIRCIQTLKRLKMK